MKIHIFDNGLFRQSRVVSVVMMALLCFMTAYAAGDDASATKSVRKERNFIRKGNDLYNQAKYRDAVKCYEQALEVNPSSAVGRFNLGLSQIRIGNVADTTKFTNEMMRKGVENMQAIASLAAENPRLAAFANYNLGNISFNKEDYDGAIQAYKQALRLNPSDDNARRNLRIAQLKKQEQNKDNKDQDKNQDKKDQEQNQDKKDQNQDQNKQNQDQKDKQTPPPPSQQDMSQQTADQILQAMENKEAQTRQRVMSGKGASKGRESSGSGRSRLNW